MNELDAFPFRVELWDHDDQHVAEVLAVARNVAIARAAYQAAPRERPGQIVRLRKAPTSSKSSTRKPLTKASQATTFAIAATLRDRATKTKKFKLGDWAHVPGIVRACWPEEGKVTLELPDGQRCTVNEDWVERMLKGEKPALID